MATELRRIVIKKSNARPGTHDTAAYFHGWGTFAHPTDDGRDFPVTKAIVELEDGTMMTCEVTQIKFVN